MLSLIISSYFNKQNKDELGLETFFIIVFCVVDNLYQLLVGPQSNLRTSNNSNPIFTDVEVITIALVGELKGENSERAWWRFVNKNYGHLFPHLCSRTRYGRRLKRLSQVMEMIRQNLLYRLDANVDSYRLVDSFPFRLAKLPRLARSSKPFEYAGSVGFCPTLKEYYYGFKVNLITELRGIPIAFVLTPANPHDTEGLKQLLNEMIELGFHSMTIVIVGDKGYIGKEYAQFIKENYGIKLMAIQKNYDKKMPKSGLNVLLTKTRRLVETTIGCLTETMNANWTYCRSIKGLITKLIAKITAFNIANYINFIINEPLLQIKGFVN
ncbi:MAG: IS982 family transposase [Cytophagales bacterium]|nr:IS982 family transposase [Cytophagales bacterium]